MRIFLSSQQSLKRHPVPTYGFWETYFKGGIAEASHEWIEAASLDWAEGLLYLDKSELKPWLERTWQKAVETIKREHHVRPISLFLSYLFPHQIDPSAIKEIRAMGIPCVNFFCDTVREYRKIPPAYQAFDLHWVPEYKALALYAQAKLSTLHAPMPVWVPPERRRWEHPEKYGVTFLGSHDDQRAALLAQVLRAGVDIEIRGPGWIPEKSRVGPASAKNRGLVRLLADQWTFVKRQGGLAWLRKIAAKFRPAFPEAFFVSHVHPSLEPRFYQDVLQQSRISVGINRYPSFHHPFSRPDTYSRLRDIEAPMVGACYLTEWTEGLDQLYDLGNEIETYRTAEEMVEKIRKLESDPPKRRAMRRQAQQRALTEHSIAKSLDRMVDALGLGRRG